MKVGMGDRLKYIATQYFGSDGKKDEKGRHLLQWLGTEIFRTKNPNFWTDSVLDMIEVFEGDNDLTEEQKLHYSDFCHRRVDYGVYVVEVFYCQRDYTVKDRLFTQLK